MTRRGVLAATLIAAISAASAGQAQEGYNIRGLVRDAAFPNQPRFTTPTLTIYIMPDDRTTDPNDSIDDKAPLPELDQGGYRFHQFLGGLERTGTFALILVEAGQGDYVLPDNRQRWKKLDFAQAGQDINVTLNLQHRQVIAEAYRRETFDTLRKGDLDSSDFERANAAALGAVELDPKIDNYLLAIRVTQSALRRGETDIPGLLTSLGDLSTLKGFDELSLSEKWRVESELLDTLVGAPDLSANISFGETVGSAAIRLGTDMTAQLDPADPILRELPATRVFQTLSVLHSSQEDCFSLVENNARAMALAEPLAMNWNSQRSLLADWGYCLKKISGFADGRPLDTVLADIAGQDTLRTLWEQFAAAADTVGPRLAFPTNNTDRRLKELHEISDAIRNRSVQ